MIISSIQLGATIDYAILFTNRYIENRSVMPKHQAGCQTVCDTAVSILTSGSILAICGIIMGVICTNKVISQLGILVGRGAILSTLTVLVALPAFLMLFDRVIQITSHKLHFYNETKPEKEKAL